MGNLAGIVLGEASAEIRSAADVALIGMGETTEDVGVVHALFLSLALLRSFRATEGTILRSADAATPVKPAACHP